MDDAAFDAAMLRLHAQHRQQKIPSISPSNATFLCAELRRTQPQNILEIGSCHGLSACYLARTAAAWGGQVTTLELSPLNHAHALRTLAPFGFSNLQALQCDALVYLTQHRSAQAAPFDWVFIDAQKSKTLDFYLALQGLLKPQATVLVDDAAKHAVKMQAFYEYLHEQKIAYSLHAVDADDATLVIELV